jgi:hypothetical protein
MYSFFASAPYRRGDAPAVACAGGAGDAGAAAFGVKKRRTMCQKKPMKEAYAAIPAVACAGGACDAGSEAGGGAGALDPAPHTALGSTSAACAAALRLEYFCTVVSLREPSPSAIS